MRAPATALALLAVALFVARVPAAAVQASLESLEPSGEARVERIDGAVRLDDPTLGEHVVLASPPARIVSLTLSSDDMLASLVAPGRVVGVTSFVDDVARSSAAGHYPLTVRRVTASAEALLALDPDLVVVAGYSDPATVRALVGAGVPVLRLPSGRSLDEVREALALLARAVFEEARAAPILERFDRTRAALATRPRRRAVRALFLAAGGFTHGRGTLTDELFRLAGATNVASEEGLHGLVRVSAEWVIAADPDVLVIAAPDDAAARRSVAWSSPGLARPIARIPVLAIPPMEMEATTPRCLEAAVRLRERLDAREAAHR